MRTGGRGVPTGLLASPPVTSVARHLERWAERYAEGRVGDLAMARIERQPGERFAAWVPMVGVTEQQAAAPMSAWVRRPGSTGLKGRAEGVAYATSERLLVTARRKVLYQWRWEDLFDVRVLPDFDGVVLARTADPEEVEVVAGEQRSFTINEGPRKRALRWIKVEGAFAASRGTLDEWLRAVPQRFDRVTPG